jgi:predicted DCC family thiol-disulfide oxidoreductase YuxK
MNSMPAPSNPILLYDGVCGFCNRFIQFTLRHDHADAFRFAALQSAFAEPILQRHDVSTTALDTVYVVVNAHQPAERLLARSEAAIFVLATLGGIWTVAAGLCRVVPRPLRDSVYNLIARNRYQVFGKFDVCPLPDPRHRHKFLDAEAGNPPRPTQVVR